MEDERLRLITEQIVRLANADFGTPGVLSDKGDDLDAIVIGLNLLGEELEAYTRQLKANEERISQMLVQLEEAQQLSHIGSWEWSIATNTVVWSTELYRIYGRDRETFEASFERFLECVHPDDREYVSNVIQVAYQNKKDFGFSHRIVRPDGLERFLDCKGTVYLDHEGAVYRMTGTAQDITELNKAKEHIANLAAIVESSNDAIFSKTPDGDITSWNKQAERMFGYSEEEVLGHHVSLLYTDEQRADGYSSIGYTHIPHETRRVCKNGEIIAISLTVSPIKNTQGKVIGYSNIARDITEKKLAEEKLLRYTAALEQKNKESEQFAYVTSHDLQEPLRTITNYIGLFRDDYQGRLEGNADIYINFITRAASRMQVLIRDLLDYTRLGSEHETKQIDCTELLNEIGTDLEQVIGESGATISFTDLPVITGHFSQTKSLFQNLISNAVKFRSSERPPEIRIASREDEKDWIFEVKDNGIGIEPAYFEKIFLLFQRLHSRSEYSGSGIGLAHCKKIVELAGGRIWVTSEPGKGSSFCFTIPKKPIQ